MDCPVCQYKGIPESASKCPNCHSDLTGFRQLHQLRRDIKIKRNTIIGMAFLIVIIIAILGYMLVFSDGLSSRFSRVAIQEKENEIVKLKKQNSQLQKQILDLQQRLDMKDVKDPGQTSGSSGQFEKVIPSPTEQEKQASSAANRTQRNQSQRSTTSAQQTSKPKEKEPEITYYRVKAGETLYSIAKRYYDDGSKYKKIMRDNNIDDPSDVEVGMKLKIIKEK